MGKLRVPASRTPECNKYRFNEDDYPSTLKSYMIERERKISNGEVIYIEDLGEYLQCGGKYFRISDYDHIKVYKNMIIKCTNISTYDNIYYSEVSYYSFKIMNPEIFEDLQSEYVIYRLCKHYQGFNGFRYALLENDPVGKEFIVQSMALGKYKGDDYYTIKWICL